MATSPDVTAVLNRLLRIVYRSLPVYLAEAKPWLDGGETARAVERIAADQMRLAQRVADALRERGGPAHLGSFPTGFTAKHDLGPRFLLEEVVGHLERDVALIEACVADLACLPHTRSLAEEILGNTRGHLETLEEMMKDER